MKIKFSAALIVFLSVLFSFEAPSQGDALLPVWKQNSVIYQKVQAERVIFVAADWKENSLSWDFVGGGHVRADLATSWHQTTQYANLAHLKWFFKKVSYDFKQQRLSLDIQFLGFRRSLVVKINERRESERARIDFIVIEGFFRDLKGELVLETLGSRVKNLPGMTSEVTELSLNATYPHQVKLFDWVFRSGAETMMHYVASELRRQIESTFRLSGATPHS